MNFLIDMGSDAPCDLTQAGTRARLILINYSEIEKIYTNDDGKIVNIALEGGGGGGGILLDAPLDAPFSEGSGLTAYEFLGFRNDVKKSDEVVKKENKTKRFKHHVSFVVYEDEQVQKNNIRDLVRGRFLVIIENKGKTQDSIEVLGKECGLEIVGQQIRNAHEAGGFFTISLSTPDNGVEFERKLPQTLGTTYGNGLDLIDELLGYPGPETPEVDGIFDFSFDFSFE